MWLGPPTFEGQVHGGVVEGLGGGLLAALRYGADGQLLTGSFADCLVPTAEGAPRIRTGHVETRPATNPPGVRGVGEGGAIPVAAALANAVSRALGADLHAAEGLLGELPLSPERVLDALGALEAATGR
jgi:carbon-monoxide dehydrogenase large subunit